MTSFLPENYQPNPQLLKDRVILITGAGSGIGKAVAIAAAQHKATVVLLGKTIKKLELVYDEIIASGAPQPAIYPFNLETTSVEEYARIADVLLNEFGRLDGLLLNAAWLGAMSPIANYDAALWSRVIHINLHANFLLARECYRALKQSTDARVLFSTDACAVSGTAYWGAYAVAKAGTDQLMRMIADEWESNTAIRVNALDCGEVATALRAHAYPGENARSLPQPHDVTPAYLYLLGPESQVMHGQRLVLTA